MLVIMSREFSLPKCSYNNYQEKGLTVWKHIETITLVFACNQLGIIIRPKIFEGCKRTWKRRQVLRRRMVLVTLDSGEDQEVTLLLHICCLLLYMYRKTTMEPLTQSMSSIHRTSGNDRQTECRNIPILCVYCIQQNI